MSAAPAGPRTFSNAQRTIGAEAIQLFISAPQQWRPPSVSDEQVASFRDQQRERR